MKSRRVEILIAAVVFVSALPVTAVVEFNDGGVWDIDYEINDDVGVDFETPGMGTTVNFLEGGSIPPRNPLVAFEDSIINISGGDIYNLIAYDSSQMTISGGSINYFSPSGDSQIDILGGSITSLNANSRTKADITGGEITSIQANEYSEIDILGGLIIDLYAREHSQFNVSGGQFGEWIAAGGDAAITIIGSGFAVDGTDVGYGELLSITGGYYEGEPQRLLTGTLLNGDPLEVPFRIGESGRVILVPEPATLLLLSFGGLILRRKKQ